MPEIADGSVEIVAVAREAGHRSKIAVASRVPGLNAKGACIGPMGQRVRNVMSELSGEKIDIIDYDEDPARFVANALSPAKVVSVTVIDANARAARVVVPDFQLSLAIGKEGQNARLAARLTGWRIDIRSDADGRRSTGAGPRPCAAARSAGATAVAATDAGGSERPIGDGRLSRDPARESGPARGASPHRRTGADVCRVPEARVGRRTAPSGGCVDGDGESAVIVDTAGNLPGRGAWLHPDQQCLTRSDPAASVRPSVAHHRFTGHLRGGRALESALDAPGNRTGSEEHEHTVKSR